LAIFPDIFLDAIMCDIPNNETCLTLSGNKLSPPKRKQIAQILDAFLGSEKVKMSG
jgi:hypothetical protein